MNNTQAMAPAPFFYYTPEANPDHRQHGHFSPHPSTVVPSSQVQHFQQPAYPQEMMYQQPQRPSSGETHMYMHPNAFSMQPAMPPMASPRPLYQKPAFLFQSEGQSLSLDTECVEVDGYIYPATPPLSISGSAISSPPTSCGLLPTPTTSAFFGTQNIEGVKEGCEGDVKSEILAGGDWTRCGSPPLTPGMFASYDSTQFVDVSQISVMCQKYNRLHRLILPRFSVHPSALGYR